MDRTEFGGSTANDVDERPGSRSECRRSALSYMGAISSRGAALPVYMMIIDVSSPGDSSADFPRQNLNSGPAVCISCYIMFRLALRLVEAELDRSACSSYHQREKYPSGPPTAVSSKGTSATAS